MLHSWLLDLILERSLDLKAMLIRGPSGTSRWNCPGETVGMRGLETGKPVWRQMLVSTSWEKWPGGEDEPWSPALACVSSQWHFLKCRWSSSSSGGGSSWSLGWCQASICLFYISWADSILMLTAQGWEALVRVGSWRAQPQNHQHLWEVHVSPCIRMVDQKLLGNGLWQMTLFRIWASCVLWTRA